MASIPVVNLRDFSHGTPQERARFVQAWGEGLTEFGFVTLGDHDVPIDLTHKVFEMASKFFALPEEAKRGYIIPDAGGARGYTAFGKEKALGASAHDLKEFWHVGQENPTGDLAAKYPKNVWPAELPSYRPILLEMFSALERCALQVLEATAIYMGMPDQHFSGMAKSGNHVLRIIHYPPVDQAASPPGAVRAAAHEDINLITLLCEASTGGLELLGRNGQWLPVSSLDGQIVVDGGDMLQLATNAQIAATTHRVVNPPAGNNKSRYSMPFFVHPRPEVMLDPAQCSGGQPPKFEAKTAHDYLTERLRAIGLYDADPYKQVG